MQRGASLRGAFAGRPGGVRRLGEQGPLRSELELLERHVAEVLRIRFTCPFFFGRRKDDRLDPGNGQRRGDQEQALGPVEPVREMPLPRTVFADCRHVARQPGEVDLDNDRPEVLRLPRTRFDRFPGRLADEQGDPAGEAFEGVAVVLAAEPGGRHHQTRREHVHQVQVVGDEQPRTGRLRRSRPVRRREHVRDGHSQLLASQRQFPPTSRTRSCHRDFAAFSAVRAPAPD